VSEESGIVRKRRVAPGSKSDREAVVLDADGRELILRRQGGDPFVDPALEELVGKRVKATGRLHGTTFIMSDWQELSDPG
jgi:hypothetical protein